MGHSQRPLLHVLSALHTLPQLPQLLLSELTSVHALPHSVPELQRTPQLKPSHVAMPLPDVGPGQVVLQARPQEVIAVLLAHVPLQSWVPNVQVHSPSVHCLPPRQLLPHVPQFAGSDKVSMHVPPHSEYTASHLKPH